MPFHFLPVQARFRLDNNMIIDKRVELEGLSGQDQCRAANNLGMSEAVFVQHQILCVAEY